MARNFLDARKYLASRIFLEIRMVIEELLMQILLYCSFLPILTVLLILRGGAAMGTNGAPPDIFFYYH